MSLERIASTPPSILFVHQGYDLYGSDRMLIQSVDAVARRWPEAKITVLLPSAGDLQPALLSIVHDVRIVNLAILRKASLNKIRLRDIGEFIKRVWEARRLIRAYDVTYVNTILVMDYVIAASTVRSSRIIHVHEIPSRLAALFFSSMAILSRALIIFNSEATRRSFSLPFWQRSAVVWNGVASPSQLPPRSEDSRLRLLLIGRFNSWKGQELLLRAVAALTPDHRSRLIVRMVGSVFADQQHFVDKLERVITEGRLGETVEIRPFTPDPYEHYSWADVVVVPSIKPEPFGLVAIEAMAAGRSVIAAKHGGLLEIVVDGVTGTFVEPGSIRSLELAIGAYIDDPARAQAEGDAGRERFQAEFEEKHYKMKIGDLVADLL
jgi:glycosyltransferase involved in cell wall biosynthesis